MERLKKKLFDILKNQDFCAVTVIFLASIAVFSRLIFNELWMENHDHIRYLCLLHYFRDSFLNGNIYPRWLPDVYGGYGYPTFVFYQPGFFYVALFFSLICIDILTAIHLTLLFFFFIGGCGMYLLAKKITKDYLISLFVSLLFIATPYLYVNLYVRGDLSEYASMLILPYPLFFLYHLKDRLLRGGLAFFDLLISALSVASVILMHPAPAMFSIPCFGIFAIVLLLQVPKDKQKKYFFAVITAFITSLVISSPYWLTLLQLKKHVYYEWAITDYFDIKNHGVYPLQLISNYWDYGGSEAGSEIDGMSFQLGLPHFILAIIGTFFGRKNKLILLSFIFYVAFIILMLPFSIPFWQSLEILRFIQFPWRLLSVIAFLQAICICGLFNFGVKHYNTAILSFTLLFCLLYYHKQFQFKPYNSPRETLQRVIQNRFFYVNPFAAGNELLPRTAKFAMQLSRGNRHMLENVNFESVIQFPDSSNYKIHFSVSSKDGTRIIVNQLYFKGWKIYMDGNEINESKILETLSPDGRIVLLSPPGEHEFLLYYDGPPGWRIRNIFIAIFLVILLIFPRKTII